VSADEHAQLPTFSRCIACGICDRGEGERMANSDGAYPGLMTLVLAVSRSMPDFRAAAYTFSFVSETVLEQKEGVCPTGVPFREIAQFVRRKADEVGGPIVPALRPASQQAPAGPRSDDRAPLNVGEARS
jgi:hypothetical protein